MGTLQWFATTAPADVLNDRMFTAICLPSYISKEQREEHWDKIRENTPSMKTTLMRDNPALQCRFFKWKNDTLWSAFIRPTKFSGVFAQVSDFFRRIEFQGRGTPHEHSLIHQQKIEKITVIQRFYGSRKIKTTPIADSTSPQTVEKTDISKAHYDKNTESKQRVEGAVNDVVTACLEDRLPCDETHLPELAARTCTGVLCGKCKYCAAVGERKHERALEKNSKWFCNSKLYFGGNHADYKEHARLREGTDRNCDYRRISRDDISNVDMRKRLIEIWLRRRIYDDLDDIDDPAGTVAPTFPTDETAAAAELELLVGSLWSDETTMRYRNWQLANQCHSCRKTCFKYDKHPDPNKRLCRFNYPFDQLHHYNHAQIFVDRDRKSRVRMRVLPRRNNSYVNNCYVDAALCLFHGGNLDVQFVANDVGAGEYTCCYNTKHEAPDTDILLKLVAKKFAELDDRCALNDRERLRAVGNSLLTASQIGKCQQHQNVDTSYRRDASHVDAAQLPVCEVLSAAHEREPPGSPKRHAARCAPA